MENPAVIPWGADRYAPFIRTLTFVGIDLAGATFGLQVRDRKNGGTLRADLGTVTTSTAEGVRVIYSGTDTVANHISAGRLSQRQADTLGLSSGTSVLLSYLGVRINKTTMGNMPLDAVDPGANRVLQWDIKITPSGGIEDKYAGGDFTVRGGVTP